MTQARNNALQTAAFARRVVCRALTVVGGVAAGTALAWWLSTASASAETQAPVDDVQTAVQVVTAPVEQAADAVARYLPDPPPPPKVTDLGQKLKDTAEQFRDQADSALPVVGTEKHHYVADSSGRSDFPTTPVVAPVATTVVPVAAVDTVVPHSAKDRAIADGMSRRGSPAGPAEPALPGLPDWPVPFGPAPAGVPTTGNHGSAGNAADSHLFAALPWQDRTTDLVAGGIAATTKAATFGRPGAQPGVAPD